MNKHWDQLDGKRALVCSYHVPQGDRDSGSRRVFDFVRFLVESGWAVSFYASGDIRREEDAQDLRQRGVAVYGPSTIEFAELLSACDFKLILLAFWGNGEQHLQVVRQTSPAAHVVVDSVDLHFVREARQAFQKGHSSSSIGFLDDNYADRMAREINTYAGADGVLAVSEKEANLINDLTGDPRLAYTSPDGEDLDVSCVPFKQRKGILFVGSFDHQPNIGAVEYLCKEVLPLLDPAIAAVHPVYIVGSGLNEKVRSFVRGLPNVRMIGWVPSIEPYFACSKISVIPLLYGAGTKRKLVQALMIGTPTVSTSIGVEGLSLRDGKHVLVSDDPVGFAASMTRLLTDKRLWKKLARKGRSRIIETHHLDAARRRFQESIADILAKAPKGPPPARAMNPELRFTKKAYQELTTRLLEEVCAAVPADATVLVINKGDPELLDLDDRRGWHFPQLESGEYAGHYPTDGKSAVNHLEALCLRGAQYLVIPKTAYWWLDYYREFKQHLESNCTEITRTADICRIYSLGQPGSLSVASHSSTDKSTVGVNGMAHLHKHQGRARAKPCIPDLAAFLAAKETPSRNVLILGVYLTDQLNTADDIAANFSRSVVHLVTQRWVALGTGSPNENMAAVTAKTVRCKTPKFTILNELLAQEDLTAYDFVLLTDDDIVIPDHFLDNYITLQERLDFSIAQPARTSNSYIDHPIVEQQRGVLARQTRFVEIGPVVSFHRSCFDLVFPFDLTSPMGWGYENVWSYLLAQRGMKMGIIDALPVDHSLRKPVANYSWAEADAQRKALLKANKHYTYDECFRVLAVASLEEARQ